MNWSNRIKEVRIAAGLKQASLADILSIDQATISRWERGVSTPTISFQFAILDKLARLNPARSVLDGMRERVEESKEAVVLTMPGSFVTDTCSVKAAENLQIPAGRVSYDWHHCPKTKHQEMVYSLISSRGLLFEDRTVAYIISCAALRLPDGSEKYFHSIYNPIWIEVDAPRLLISHKKVEDYTGQEGSLTFHRITDGKEKLKL